MRYVRLLKPDALRAWPRVTRKVVVDETTGCHEWNGSVGSSGYGKVRIGRTQDYSTHRIAWVAAHDEIPDGFCIMHACDNRRCVNPSHLRLGTHSDNTKDAYLKGRLSSPMSKRTHCPQGHAYSGVNSNGARICRTCQSAATLRHYHRTKRK